MAEVFVTRHAIKRYRERVAKVSAPAVWRALDCPAVRTAIALRARFVRLGGGQRVVLQENRVVTILPRDHPPGLLDPIRDAFYDGGEGHAEG